MKSISIKIFSIITSIVLVLSFIEITQNNHRITAYALTSGQTELIEMVGNYAKQHYNQYKILPSFVAAQALQESAVAVSSHSSGLSSLARMYHNYFGMKAGNGYTGSTVNLKTNEQTSAGEVYDVNAAFRAYASFEEGMKGYYDFIYGNGGRYKNLIGVTDYKKVCQLVKEDGWATDIKYTQGLINKIENFNLTRFDNISENSDPYMNISGETKPTGTLTPGKSFAIKGIISSYPNMEAVWGGVAYRDGGGYVDGFYYQEFPNTSSYDLSKTFDNKLIFNNLPVGYYTYYIYGRDTSKKEYELIKSDFQVGEPIKKPTISELSASSYVINTGQSITFTAKSDTATGYTIGIDKDGVRKITEEMPNGELTKLFTETGTYSAYVTSYNSAGYCDSARITFTVSVPAITVTLNPNGGKCSKSSIIVNKGGTYSGLVDATDKTGYIFAGWFTQDGKQVHNGDKLASDTAHTLSAHWTAKSVSVNFYRNQNKDDTGTVTESFTYDVKNQKFGYKIDGTGRYSPMNAANVGFGAWTRTGYELLGWSADRNANTTAYSTYSGVSNEWINSYSSSINLYAIWKAKQYKVTLNTNGGTVNSDSIVVTYDSTYNLPNAEKTGYHFNGWFTSSDGGTQVSSNDKVSITGEQTLYAHWSKDTMMITFNTKGGTSESGTKFVKYDNKYGVLPNAERTGYIFEGWYLDENCTNQITSDSIVKITANQSVYAKWTLKKCTVNFDANGGTVQTASKQVTYGKNYGVLPVAVKENDTFIGWFTEDGTEITSGSIVELVDDTVFYAKWRIQGDVNADGVFDKQDIVTVQDWLLAKPKATLADWHAADVCQDECINIFDLCILKQILLERNGDML